MTIGGNTINAEESKTAVEQSETVGKVFDILAGSKGEISDLLNEYAERLDNAKGHEKTGIKQAFLDRLHEIVPELIKGRYRGGAEGSRADAEGRHNLTSSQENKKTPSRPDFSKISLKVLSRVMRKHPEMFPVKKKVTYKVDDGCKPLRLDGHLNPLDLWQKMPVK